MKFNYGEFDGKGFQTPDMLFPSTKVVQFILQYGQDALDAMNNLEKPDEQQYIDMLVEAGLLERDEDGNLRMTPRMVRGIESKALLEIFQGTKRGSKEGHPTQDRGRSDERADGTKPYEFGDPISEIDVAATMRNAARRQQAQQGGSLSLPLNIRADDFELHLSDGQSDVATCILMDLSGSMMRYGRFYHAKRVALGMAELVRQRFPQDTIDYVGFSSLAERIEERDLPLVMPKPISTREYEVRVRAPLAQAQQNPKMIPQHFTNLQLGLRMARQLLQRRGAANKQIFIITDGQPTAHVEAGAAGEEMLYLLYPPTQHTSDLTLQEALRCHQQGIRIATFALIEDYWGMDWVGFVDKLTRLIRGTAFYCAGDDLSSVVVESYLNGKRRKSYQTK